MLKRSLSRRPLAALLSRAHSSLSSQAAADPGSPRDKERRLAISPVTDARMGKSMRYPTSTASVHKNHPAVKLAETLINIESVTGNENEMSSFVTRWLENRGFKVILQEVAPNRTNVYACPKSRTPFTGRVCLNTHMDVVPPWFPSSVDGDKLRGRGACDTKGLIASMLLAADRVVRENPNAALELLFVVGEEVDHCGMTKACELGLSPAYMIVGEPTDSRLASRQKGLLNLVLEVQGKSAHSGYPESGVCAVTPLIGMLRELQTAEYPSGTTLNVGVIKAGAAANVVPDRAMASLMYRLTTPPEFVRATIDPILARHSQGETSVSMQVVCANSPVDLTVFEDLGMEIAPVSYNTDIPYFTASPLTKFILYGGGNILVAHSEDEHILLTDLPRTVEAYVTLVNRTLSICGVETRLK